MEEFLMSYREVIPDQTCPEKWNDIVLNTGGTQSTLQDIKVSEKAGGYCFKGVAKNHNRNRFITWRTYHDTLELSEISLDINLIHNHCRYKFAESPVLSVAIFESHEFVVILVATVSSLHRLYFPHPDKVHCDKGDMGSIFSDASITSARDPSTYFVLTQSTSSNNPIPHTAACEMSSNGETALFSLAYPTTLMLFEMDCMTGETVSQELKQQHIMPRLLGNLTASLRGKSKISDNSYATSLVFNTIGYETFLYALYRDDHIRMWSTKTNQCVATVNCVREGVDPRPQGPQTNALRRASPTTLCVFLCYATGSEFVTIQTSFDGGSNYMMTRTNLIAASEYDLVDFEINESRIWGLWCNSQVEFNISSISLQPEHGVTWTSAALEPPQDRFTMSGEQATDPKEAYCSFIFHPGKFQKSVIAKALVMFRRSNILADSNLPMSILRDRVCQAVETEIQNELKDFDVSDEEYIEQCTSHWERFYSCCEQYHVKACQPVGLVIMESFGAVAVIKKSEISLLRPCDTLEHLMLAGENADVAHLAGTSIANDANVSSDLVKLVSVLSVLEEHICDEIKMNIDKKLHLLEIPNLIISNIVADLLSRNDMENGFDREFVTEIRQEIQSISDLPGAMMALLEMLRIDSNDNQGMQMQDDECGDVGKLFGSNYGISLLAESLRQVATIRYSICRHLLILQHILTDTFALPCDILEIIASKCMPETVVYLQAYNVMVWICEEPATASNAITCLETNIQRLAILKLNDKSHMMTRPSQPVTLLELFLRGKGSQIGLAQFAEGPFRNLSDTQWQFTLLPMINIIGQLIWSVSGSFDFGEWLISSCQHILVYEYVRLLNPWCEWNKCSRQFILGVSLLDNGSPEKAYDLFMQSANGVLSEMFLIEKIIQIGDGISAKDVMAQYFLKIIQLFEQYSALDYVIDLAQAAIDGLNKEDPQLAMFQSIIFTNHLLLDHYEEAYNSLIYNAEHTRRKDCLRQLVVCLFEEKRLDLLMSFPYVGLQEELESIVESRARSMVIEDNDHYNFLYAFHIAKDNFRKAAIVMYEKAMRFQSECDAPSSMRSRYECLLSCINILNLVDPKYAWIARPPISDQEENNKNCKDASQSQLLVLEINDIRKEMLLTEAILLLASSKNMNMILNAGPTELAAVLANNGHFTGAVKLANGFGVSVAPILDILTSFCVGALDAEPGNACAWLHNNNLGGIPRKSSQIDMAWGLLQKLLHENVTKDDASLYKSVTNKILYLCAFLPQWLISEYKLINASELLHLYVSHGRLIEASELASEYIWAILGRGFEYFGLKNALIATMPQTCFPVSTIDHLMYALKLNSKEDVEYSKWYADLDELVKHFINTAQSTSSNKIEYELNKSHSLEFFDI